MLSNLKLGIGCTQGVVSSQLKLSTPFWHYGVQGFLPLELFGKHGLDKSGFLSFFLSFFLFFLGIGSNIGKDVDVKPVEKERGVFRE